jgi:hypothetical protein
MGNEVTMIEVVPTEETIAPHRPVKAAQTATMEPSHSAMEPTHATMETPHATAMEPTHAAMETPHPATMEASHAATMEASHAAAATMPAKSDGVGRKIGNRPERHTGNNSSGKLAQHDTPPCLQFDLFSISQKIARAQMTSLLSFSRTGESLIDFDRWRYQKNL